MASRGVEISRLESKCLSFVMHRSPCSQKSHVIIRAAIWKAVSGDESEIVESKMRTGQRQAGERETSDNQTPFYQLSAF